MSGWHSGVGPRPAIAILALALLLLVYWIAFTAPALGIFHDDGVYLVTAKALATGKGYRIISLPGEIPQTKYPILFPLLLAIIWKIFPQFPQNTLLLKAVPLACTLVWLWLTYRLVKRETDQPALAFGIALLTAASPWVLFLSTTLLSEMLFAALITGALLLLLRQLEDSPAQPALLSILAALLSAAAFLTRTAGSALIAAGFIALMIKRRFRCATIYLAVCGALCAAWIHWQASQPAPPLSADAYYSSQNYRDWNVVLGFNWNQKVRIVATNLLDLAVAPAVLLGAKPHLAGVAASITVALLAAAGFYHHARRNFSVIHIFLLLYSVLLLAWSWPLARFFVPVLPLALMMIFQAVKSRPWLRKSLAAVLVIECALALQLTTLRTLREQCVGFPYGERDNWREMRSLLAWIQKNTPPEAVIQANLDPVIYLYTGRKSVRGFVQDPFLLHYSSDPAQAALGSQQQMAASMLARNVSYLVQTPNRMFQEKKALNHLIAQLRSDYPGALRPVAGSGEYRIYEVDRARLADRLKHFSDAAVRSEESYNRSRSRSLCGADCSAAAF